VKTIILGVVICVSTILLAYSIRHSRRDRELANSYRFLRGALRFLGGPVPLSIALHVSLRLFLIITMHESRARELTLLTLEAGGGGGGGSEMNDLDLPEVPMPEFEPVTLGAPAIATNPNGMAILDNYIRAASTNGIGVSRGGGLGNGYGHGIGDGFPGYLLELRRKGLDVVLVIDGTGSMSLIIQDVKARMRELVAAIHQMVPTAKVGIVVYGGKRDAIASQPLTLSPSKLVEFLGSIRASGGDEWEEDVRGAIGAAIDNMDWRPYANKIIVLVGDSPPKKDDFAPLLAQIHSFRDNNGTLNTIDVAAEEHERFEREFWHKVHGAEPPQISPLPEFYQQTRAAFKVLANAGGGAMRSLSKDSQINQQVLVLAFGEQWQSQVAAFGRGITSSVSAP
jgi:hypothetical protein